MFEFDFSELVDFGDALVNTFDDAIKEALQKVAKELLKLMKRNTPRDTGKLASGWDTSGNLAFRVQQDSNGYFVELVNATEYASWVNDGHHSYNQFGGPYIVKNRTVKYYQGNKAATFVYGHFFVEKSILELEESKAVKRLVDKCLYAWFEGCAK